ncbi:MAG: hypothetical protein KTR15_01365 [Phycisphaeraceae bacterium]|nr:hypothetical protein [Phycisphaeraceae bacterium]
MTRYVSILDRLPRTGLAGVVLALVAVHAMPAAAQDDAPPPPTDIDNDADKLGVQSPAEEDLARRTEAEEEAAAEEAAAAQAALASELASAGRFETELNELLLPDGQLDTSQDDAHIKLMSLATRCGILSNSAMHDEVRLVLLGYQARALAAMSSIRPARDPGQAEQLNDVAQQIAAIELPGAAAAADYWLLIADMTQQASAKQTPAKRQARTERALRAFIRRHAQDAAAAEYLLDTRLALAELMDQRGAQDGVAKQLEWIGELPKDSPRLGDTNRLHRSVERIGTPITFDSISTQLMNWRSSDHIGKPVLIHVYADSVEPSLRMIDVISRSIVEGSLSGIAVVSLRVGDPVAGSSSPPWPTLPVQLEPDGVLDQLGVAALPTLAWLDREGKLASIGTTAAVLNQLDVIQLDEPEVATDDADASEPPQKPAGADAAAPDELPDPDETDVENAPF